MVWFSLIDNNYDISFIILKSFYNFDWWPIMTDWLSIKIDDQYTKGERANRCFVDVSLLLKNLT